MKRYISLLLLAALYIGLLPLSIPAQATKDGYLTYSVSNGQAAVTDCDTSASGVLVIPDTVEGYPVTSIGGSAFYGCDALTSVTIPEGVTDIGGGAFSGCTGLTDVTIPEGVIDIESGTFKNCSNLTSVTVPESVVSVISTAFSGCTALSYTTLDNCKYLGNSENPYHALVGAVTTTVETVAVHPDTKVIASNAFSGCTGLTDITIPDGVIGIGGNAFYNCSALSYTTLSDCKYLGNAENPYHALIDTVNKSMRTVSIHSDTKVIASNAFFRCASLTSVTIPEGSVCIGSNTFGDCTSLTNVTIPGSVIHIGESAFESCERLTSLVIPEKVASIEAYAFFECYNLETLWFCGEAPFIDRLVLGSEWLSDCFAPSIDITAYYHAGTVGWSEAVYYEVGTITFVEKEHLVTKYTPNGDYTCTEDGTKTGTCIQCGASQTVTDEGSARGHRYQTLVTPPVDTEAGYTTYTCTACSYSYRDNYKFRVSFVVPDGVAPIADYMCSESGITLPTAGVPKGEVQYTFLGWTTAPLADTTTAPTVLKGRYIAKENITLYALYSYTQDSNFTTMTTQTLRGSITTGTESDTTVELLSGDKVIAAVTVSGPEGTYSIEGVPMGTYTLKASKLNHVTREYTVTVAAEAVTQAVKLHLTGDINGDGNVNMGDVAQLYAHIRGTRLITDEYQILCADINGNNLNMGDTAALYSHIKGTKKLY